MTVVYRGSEYLIRRVNYHGVHKYGVVKMFCAGTLMYFDTLEDAVRFLKELEGGDEG